MRKRWLCGCLILLLLGLTACQNQTEPVTRSGFALDTAVSVTVYGVSGKQADSALEACFAELARLENRFSATVPESDISRLNEAGGQPVTVSEDTAQLLTQALSFAALSDGALDVTIRPVSVLWDFHADAPSLPDASALALAVRRVDYRQVTVQNTTVTLPNGVQIEPGGIAKGYIADRLRDVLQQRGITSALINLGGNIVACGNKNGNSWRVGIKDPADTQSLFAVVTGEDFAVVTSGIYERGFTLDGVRYHHLLDPATGMPVQNGLASVTIVCPSSTQADALSTACFVMGEDRALALLDTLPDTEALFIRQDGTCRATDGLDYTRR